MNLVCYHGNPATNSQAKDLAGVTLLANRPIPPSGLSFYYECHVCGLGAAKESDAAVALTIGLTPPPPTSKPSGDTSGFNLPQGACGARRSVLWGAGGAVECCGVLGGIVGCCGVLWDAVECCGVLWGAGGAVGCCGVLWGAGECCGVLGGAGGCCGVLWSAGGAVHLLGVAFNKIRVKYCFKATMSLVLLRKQSIHA